MTNWSAKSRSVITAWIGGLTLRLNEVRIANVQWAEGPMARIEELSVTLDVGALVQGEIELERVGIRRPEVVLLRRDDGTTNIDDLFDEEPTEEQEIPLWPEAFNIDRGRLVLRDAGQEIELELAFATPGESVDELSVDVRGVRTMTWNFRACCTWRWKSGVALLRRFGGASERVA